MSRAAGIARWWPHGVAGAVAGAVAGVLVAVVMLGAVSVHAQHLHVQHLPPGAPPAGAITEVNTATEAELDSVRGIGPDLSARLLAERARTAFSGWPDLIHRVKPMGPALARRLSDAGLRVNGQPYAADRQQP